MASVDIVPSGECRASCTPLVPRLRQPDVLSYEAWCERVLPYLCGMQDYLERVLAASPAHPPGVTIRIDRDGLFAAFFRYVYRTSINRFRSYTIID